MKDNVGAVAGAIIGVIILCIIEPTITFGAGWFGGWILMKIVGGAVVTGLNTLFGTTRFMPDLIPVVCGVLAVVGSYFNTSVSNNK